MFTRMRELSKEFKNIKNRTNRIKNEQNKTIIKM